MCAAESATAAIDAVLESAPVIAVCTFGDRAAAIATARALVAGGIGTIEVTLRSDRALEALRAIAAEVPQARVGAGTVLGAAQLEAAVAAGAGFVVAPGATPALLAAAADWGGAFLPGVATASELMRGLEAGLTRFKFFPARPAGGPDYLAALAAPFPQVRFCPTGGIGRADAADWLALPNVACVGGSWLTPAATVAAGDWAAITALAAEAAALRRR